MAAKPNVTTQLLDAKDRITELEGLLEKAEAKVKEKENTITYYKDIKEDLESEVEAVHDFLDSVPNAVGRTYVKKDSWGDTKRSVLTRLTAWLVSKDTPAVTPKYNPNN